MKTLTKWAALAAVLLLAGCASATQATREVLDALVNDGAITPDQREQIMGSLATGWEIALGHVGDILAGAVLAYTGINLRRGPPTRAENVAKKQAS